jgi:hypothetical protein
VIVDAALARSHHGSLEHSALWPMQLCAAVK